MSGGNDGGNVIGNRRSAAGGFNRPSRNSPPKIRDTDDQPGGAEPGALEELGLLENASTEQTAEAVTEVDDMLDFAGELQEAATVAQPEENGSRLVVEAGRNTLLTDNMQQELSVLIGAGNTFKTACAFVGISYRTFSDWMQRGEGTHPTRPQTPEYVQFVHTIKKAHARACVKQVQTILNAAKAGSWQAACWWLERRDPEGWGRQSTVEVSGLNGGPIVMEQRADVNALLDQLSTEQLEQFLAISTRLDEIAASNPVKEES